MTKILRIPEPFLRSPVSWESWKRYLGIGLALNAAIWGTALFYLQIAPRTYTSNWTIALPRGGEQSNINLPDVGSATSSIQSPYSNTKADPRKDYSYIATSEPVLEVAATNLDMKLGEFGRPRIENLPDTMLMHIEVEGDSPQEAQLKSESLYEALTAKLAELRIQEAAQKQERLQATLASSQMKLKAAQQNLSDYKARSDLTSGNQIDQLSSTIEQLRKERVQAIAQLEQADAGLRQLSTSLQLTPQQATEAYKLQTDPYLQQLIKDYGETSAAVVSLNSRYTLENPALVNEKARQEDTQAAFIERSQYLLNKQVPLKYVEQLSLNNSPSRQQLLQNLVSVQADRQGLQSRVRVLEQQMAELEHRLRNLIQQKITLDNLEREDNIAEAIFTSTLAQLDLRDGDVFGSYPQIQIIEEPSLPKSPSAPKILYVVAGAIFGSFCLTTGLVLLWLSKRNLILNQVKPA